MAYDPEARKQSNNALIIGLITLVVVGGAALAYFATRQPVIDETSPVIVNREKETVIVGATPEPGNNVTNIIIASTPVPGAVIEAPPANTTTPATTMRNADVVSDAPVASPPVEQPKTTVNNTIINPPVPSGNAKPVKPDAPVSAAPPVSAPAVAPDTNAVEGY